MAFIFTPPRQVLSLTASGTRFELERGSYFTFNGAYGEGWG